MADTKLPNQDNLSLNNLKEEWPQGKKTPEKNGETDTDKLQTHSENVIVFSEKMEALEQNTATSSDEQKLNKEYVLRASAMRAIIEEKISEIEEKMDLPSTAFSPVFCESKSSLPDYSKKVDVRRFRSSSVSEMRQSNITMLLQSKLEKAEKDLKMKEHELVRLRKMRGEVGSEIEDLTASLFEEANNLVKEAYIKQQKAEKSSMEANMKLAILQEEVKALKTIVQSTKEYTPPIELHDASEKKAATFHREPYEVDPIFNKDFVTWRQNPNFDKDDPFLKRIYEEDIYACLYFGNKELSLKVLSAIEEDKIIIENIHDSKNEPLPKVCALMDAPRLCPYKMYLEGNGCYSISALSRNRITAVCDLLCYFKYIQKGFITLSIHEVYLEILKKRRRITSAKLGLVDDIIQ